MSHGYEVEATPLQVLSAYSVLANGGTLYRPYVVAEERDVYGHTVWSRSPEPIRGVFKKSTTEALLPAFERVVTDGTGKLAAVEGLRIAGKTGTAQKTENGSYARGKHRATFAGFFPADNPQVTLVIVLDEPEKSAYGGIVAAPIFASIARRWVATMPAIAPPIGPVDRLADTSYVSVPELRRQPIGIAFSRLAVHGLDVADREKPANPFALVADQMPAEGTDVRPSTPVRINVAALPAQAETVDLIGLSCRHAVNMLVAKGITVRVDGYGRVVRTTGRGNTPAIVHCE
jgi:cell division protein FtsI (penicillin-binding protein 3)